MAAAEPACAAAGRQTRDITAALVRSSNLFIVILLPVDAPLGCRAPSRSNVRSIEPAERRGDESFLRAIRAVRASAADVLSFPLIPTMPAL